jgi:hypothetical protein
MTTRRIPELLGANRKIAGSQDYFKALNSGTLLANLLSSPDSVMYGDDTKKVAAKIGTIFDEVHSDLRRHIKVIRHIPHEQRVNMSRFIRGLEEICKMVGVIRHDPDRIVRILTLADHGTSAFSRASERDISEAIRVIDRGNFSISRFDRMRLIDKAADQGIERAANRNAKHAAFLIAVTNGQRQSREFLKDLQLALQWQNSPREFRGRNGRVICSLEYKEEIEKRIFGASIPNYYTRPGGSEEYVKSIKSGLSRIAAQIPADIDGHGLTHDILHENQERLRVAAGQLARLGDRSLAAVIDGLLEPYEVIKGDIHIVTSISPNADYQPWTAFATADLAAIAFGLRYADYGNKIEHEIGALIYSVEQNGSTSAYYTFGEIFTGRPFSPQNNVIFGFIHATLKSQKHPSGSHITRVAQAHTHPISNRGDVRFSPQDKALADGRWIPIGNTNIPFPNPFSSMTVYVAGRNTNINSIQVIKYTPNSEKNSGGIIIWPR